MTGNTPATTPEPLFTDDSLDPELALARFAGTAPAEPEEVVPSEAPAPDPAVVPPAADPAPVKSKVTDLAAEVPVPAAEETPPEDPPKPADRYADIQLGPHARPNTAATFAQLKERAARDLQEREDKLAAANTELEALRAKPAVDPAIESELAELRAFRESVALEGDPVFAKRFDAPIAKIDEDILGKLKSAGMTDEDIEQIKKIGIDKLDWGQVFQGLPTVKWGIERKLGEREALREARVTALTEAKGNLQKAVEHRRELDTLRSTEITEKATNAFGGHLKALPVLKKEVASATDTPERKAAIAERNKAIDSAISEGRATLGQLDTPEGRAEAAAIVAMAWLFKSERDALAKRVGGIEAEGKGASAKLSEQVAKLTADLAAAHEQLGKYRKSAGLPANNTARPVAPSGSSRLFESAEDALARFQRGEG